jgi:transposase
MVRAVELPLCASCESTQRENRRLRTAVEQLEKDNERLVKQHELDQAELSRLKDLLEKARRAGKRQAAPFSKGSPKKQPRRPGRKRGEKYGTKAHRQPPMRVHETFEAPLPKSCPECDGEVEEQRVAIQYQADLPPVIEPWVSQFNVHIGDCLQCGRRLQGRHPLQTSDALGAAASQVGPRALALVAELKLATGMSYAKLSHLLGETFHISITPGGLCLALQRVGRVVEPTYEALKQAVRRAPWVSPDETGWRVGAASAWLWVYVTTWATFYVVEIGRGFQEAAKVLGEDYRGKMIRDGWAAYLSLSSQSTSLNPDTSMESCEARHPGLSHMVWVFRLRVLWLL